MADENFIDWAKASTFADIYWASWHPDVAAMRHMPSVNSLATQDAIQERMARGQDLTAKGYDIDPSIMVWDAHPWFENMARINFAATRQDYYLNGKPIVPSVDSKDYPPYGSATAACPFQRPWNRKAAPDGTPNGVGSLWTPLPTDNYAVGGEWTDTASQYKYRKVTSATAGGNEKLWERVA